jgi:GT2 family glycosyltransferase
MVTTYIITPNYNGKKFLDKYFTSLSNQTFQDFKIIFVDNSTNDESIDHIKNHYYKQLNNIVLIKNPRNYGFARANNIGIEVALKDKDCKYIICLNNDTQVEPKFLEELIACAVKHPNAGSVQAKLIWSKDIKLIDSVGLEYSKNGLGFNRGAYKSIDNYREETEIFGCCAGAALYKKEALNDIKINNEFFDDDFFAYYEDFDLALRLRWAGWSSWYSPNAVVYHYKGGTAGGKTDFTVYYEWRNYTWTVFKNLPTSYIIKKSYLIVVCEISQILINLIRRKPIIVRSKLAAYRNIGKFLKKKKLIKKTVEFKDIEGWFVFRWREEIPK